jgi:hypothetical protein
MAKAKDIQPDGVKKMAIEPDGAQSSKVVDDDVEGHSMAFNPSLGRDLARARSADIDRSVRAKQLEADAKRPNHK